MTIGDHVRAKRLDLGLTQLRLAEQLGVNECTVMVWEKNHTSPDLYLIPRVIEFLGYNPLDSAPKTQGEMIVNFRRARGMSQEALARALGIDPSTLWHWQHGRVPSEETLVRIMKTEIWRGDLGRVLEQAGIGLRPQPQGDALLRFRKSQGMTVLEMARALGTSRSTIWSWEKGMTWPKGEVLERIKKTEVWREGLGRILEPDDRDPPI